MFEGTTTISRFTYKISNFEAENQNFPYCILLNLCLNEGALSMNGVDISPYDSVGAVKTPFFFFLLALPFHLISLSK